MGANVNGACTQKENIAVEIDTKNNGKNKLMFFPICETKENSEDLVLVSK